ncbi:MAG: YbhB/YbcL family Raf kinase inhibitor-like protein [Dehalococcoidia bacterium]
MAAMATLALLAACGSETVPLPAPPEGVAALDFTQGFVSGSQVRIRHTCDGLNLSPEVTWRGLPEAAETITIIVNDPDAPDGVFIHWVAYDIPASLSRMDEGTAGAVKLLRGGGVQGPSGFGIFGFSGPCPPREETHRYVLHIYALDAPLGLEPGVKGVEVAQAMDGHVLAHGSVSGVYKRTPPSDQNIVFNTAPEP